MIKFFIFFFIIIINMQSEFCMMHHIFVHGTALGLHLYKENKYPNISLKGLYNSFPFLTSWQNEIDKRKLLYSNKVFFKEYKKRAELFAQNEWPLIMGFYPGLSIIEHPKSVCLENNFCEGCISNIAFKYLFEPLTRNMKLVCPEYSHFWYSFNWCGDLSDIDRSLAGELLAFEIEKIYKNNPSAIIRIYGHSHGGNVILHAASLLSKKNIKIDTVVCLGMPIGIQTKKLLQSISNIKVLLNCYSRKDWIQIGDLFFNNGFCERKLPKMYFVKNIELLFYDENNKEIKISHPMLYFLWRHDPTYCMLLYIPQLIKDMESLNKTNLKYKIHKKDFLCEINEI